MTAEEENNKEGRSIQQSLSHLVGRIQRAVKGNFILNYAWQITLFLGSIVGIVAAIQFFFPNNFFVVALLISVFFNIVFAVASIFYSESRNSLISKLAISEGRITELEGTVAKETAEQFQSSKQLENLNLRVQSFEADLNIRNKILNDIMLNLHAFRLSLYRVERIIDLNGTATIKRIQHIIAQDTIIAIPVHIGITDENTYLDPSTIRLRVSCTINSRSTVLQTILVHDGRSLKRYAIVLDAPLRAGDHAKIEALYTVVGAWNHLLEDAKNALEKGASDTGTVVLQYDTERYEMELKLPLDYQITNLSVKPTRFDDTYTNNLATVSQDGCLKFTLSNLKRGDKFDYTISVKQVQ